MDYHHAHAHDVEVTPEPPAVMETMAGAGEHAHEMEARTPFLFDFFRAYVPREQCMFYEADLILLHVISDFFIAFSYFSIPVALVYFARRRSDLTYNWMFWMFALFIILCGLTHVIDILSIWHALYRVDGVTKLLTAIASVGTAFLVWRYMPVALALPSANALVKRRDELEDLVAQRTVDLTKANERLRQSEEQANIMAARADEAYKTKSAFMHTITRELKKLLRIIRTTIQQLAPEPNKNNKTTQQYETLEMAMNSLSTLVDDLFDLGQIDETRQNPQKEEPFYLSDLLYKCGDCLKEKTQHKNLNIKINTPQQNHVFLGDPVRIKQALEGLLSTAAKTTKTESISLAAHVMPHEKTGWRQVYFVIKDNGTGAALFQKTVPPQDMINALSPERSQGKWLGLVISQQLVDIMGGVFSIEDAGGEGTEYRICLPLKIQRAAKS